MQKVVHKAEERGVAEHGWLHSRFSFSFADWYEPTRMGFGALRVINDDVIDPANGFGMHPHRDMEIITIVTKGTVTHQDSMGNKGEVHAGEVQVMSAGTGVVHSEYNDSTTDALELFQIWIVPDRPSHAPRYAQKKFPAPLMNEPQSLVGPWGSDAPLVIHQHARITRLTLDAPYTFQLAEDRGAYCFVVSGTARVAGETVRDRDAVGVWSTPTCELVPEGVAHFMVIEVPLK